MKINSIKQDNSNFYGAKMRLKICREPFEYDKIDYSKDFSKEAIIKEIDVDYISKMIEYKDTLLLRIGAKPYSFVVPQYSYEEFSPLVHKLRAAKGTGVVDFVLSDEEEKRKKKKGIFGFLFK